MSFDVDEDILQDFLIEAGEILELLSGQLVELENDPDNRDLLNAIFRGFHTVKGGAGFLALDALVDTCHGAENVFDTLRNGGRQLSSELMDVILQSLDTINEQFAAVQAREDMQAADPALLHALDILSQPGDHMPGAAAEPEKTADRKQEKPTEISGEGGVDEMSDDEFESLLDELHGPASASASPAAGSPASSASNDEMTDDEFEALLDELQGAPPAAKEPAKKAAQPAAASSESGDMSDDEFEALLDELHGNQAPSAAQPAAAKPAAKSESAKKAAPVSAEKPAVAKPAPARAAPPPAAETTVRVDTRRLDEIMNM